MGKGVQGREMTWHYDTYTVATQSTLHLDVHRVKARQEAHLEGKRRVVCSIADKHHTTIQDVTPLDPSALHDAASMAGFAQITAERAGG